MQSDLDGTPTGRRDCERAGLGSGVGKARKMDHWGEIHGEDGAWLFWGNAGKYLIG
jgi:hypothetical protein